MRCRELDIFKILEFFWEIFRNFFGIIWRIFLEEFFGRIFWEEFFGRNFLEGIFWEKFLGGFFWDKKFTKFYYGSVPETLESSSKSMKLTLLPCSHGFTYCKFYFLIFQVIGGAVHSVIQQMKAKRQFILNFGFNTFLEAEWVRLRIPSLLRTFWLTRMSQQLISIFVQVKL